MFVTEALTMSQPRTNSDSTGPHPLLKLGAMADYSLLRELKPDPEQEKHVPNKVSRQVRSGHYVEVMPTKLPKPIYIAHSPSMVAQLGLTEAEATSEAFTRFFSGDFEAVSGVPGFHPSGWGTAYALSIYGQEMYSNCPFRNGNGYGDGRAVSVLEVAVPSNTANQSEPTRWELQLKGGGTTPWCRGGDGRAVLRSSVREYLASEAMHHLGVPTSRGLSLIVSETERVNRMWYSENSKSEEPDQIVFERCAIATRVAPSFLRVGQLELYGRRARKGEHPEALNELRQIVQHTLNREYPEIAKTALSFEQKVLAMAKEFANRLARLVANWIRVGYCQGNFNSDNCAAGGFTLDYGPFGFMEKFDPGYQMWIGGGEHFAFMNQPNASAMNFKMFCIALSPLFQGSQLSELQSILSEYTSVVQKEMESMWSAKMGLLNWNNALYRQLIELMYTTPVDYTIFFRELSKLPQSVEGLRPAFYEMGKYKENPAAVEEAWKGWLSNWHEALAKEGRPTGEVAAKMVAVNPKYTPREWMLVAAYKAADKGEYSPIYELQQLFEKPYDEGPARLSSKYYAKADVASFGVGGADHMSCSS